MLEQELNGLRHLGVDAVLCVTGDARGYDVRPDVTQVFDLDGPRLAALAAAVGLPAAVPETPAAPPRDLRPFRLAPEAAGRGGGRGAEPRRRATRWPPSWPGPPGAGVTIPVIAAVAVFTDEPSAAVLSAPARAGTGPGRGPGACWPTPTRSRPASPRRRPGGRGAAGHPGVAGVNLSGLGSARGYEYAAQVKAELARRIREEHAHEQVTAASPMDAEFDTVAEWTAEVAESLGPEYRIPAACRGSGRPSALDWLLAGLDPRPGDLMIDIGAGLGGPAAYAAERTGVQPVLVEPEPDACRAAAPAVRRPGGPGRRDRPAVRRRRGRHGLVPGRAVHGQRPGRPAGHAARTAPGAPRRRPGRAAGVPGHPGPAGRPAGGQPLPQPEPARHPAQPGRAGRAEPHGPADLAAPSAFWHERTATVESELEHRHGTSPAWRTAEAQSGRIGRLLKQGQLQSQVLLLERA